MNAPLLLLLLPAPLAMLACLVLRGRAAGVASIAGAALTLGGSLALVGSVPWRGPWVAARGWLHVDALAALLALIVALSGLAAAWYAGMGPRADHAHSGRFHALLMLLLASLTLSSVANNLGLLWFAIEASTLASAVLIGFDRSPRAMEAGWRFLVLCSAGLALALFATVLLYCSALPALGEGAGGLRWTALRESAVALEPRFVRLAFLFALVGYGTKIGFAPLHAWLPDAYGEAPAPAAVMMSGGLLAAAMVALLRIHAIAVRVAGGDDSGRLLMLFGIVSMLIAVPFILIQGDLRRLLAFSSLEHAGLVALAIGFGGPLATMAGMFHLLSQSLAKSLAFLSGDTLRRIHGSPRFDHWGGAIAADRAAGALFVIAGVAIAGLPPTVMFLSQWLVALGGFRSGHVTVTVLALALQGIVFAGLAFHWTRVALGPPAKTTADAPPPAGGLAPQWALAATLILLGAWIPPALRRLLEQAAAVVQP